MNQTFQTSEPIERLSLNTHLWMASHYPARIARGDMLVDAPYQRGSVWTPTQRILLIKSLMLRLPIGVVTLNDRTRPPWLDAHPGYLSSDDTQPLTSVIDGKQRIETIDKWFKGELAVPASWFDRDDVVSTTDTADGPYLTFDQLTEVGRRRCDMRWSLPANEAQLATVEDEANLYLLINGQGTPQTEEDLARATRAANKLR